MYVGIYNTVALVPIKLLLLFMHIPTPVFLCTHTYCSGVERYLIWSAYVRTNICGIARQAFTLAFRGQCGGVLLQQIFHTIVDYLLHV